MFNTKIGPNKALLQDDIGVQNLGDLEIDLSKSLKVKCKGAIGLPIFWFPINV